MSPVLAGGFFTASATWEAPYFKYKLSLIPSRLLDLRSEGEDRAHCHMSSKTFELFPPPLRPQIRGHLLASLS